MGFVILLAFVAGASASPDPVAGPETSPRTVASHSFVFETPPVSTEESPEGLRIEIPGFTTPERRAGAPEIPTKSVLVAIPPGVTPRLTFRVGAEDVLEGGRPRPVPRRVMDLDEGGATGESPLFGEDGISSAGERLVFSADASVYRGARSFPRRVAWLGEVGVLRSQRYVKVHLAPVRFDPSVDGLRVARTVELTVHFDGDRLDRTAPRVDPRFESVYRAAFVNYSQGMRFRLDSRVADDASPGGSAAASTGSGQGGSSSLDATAAEAPRYWIRVQDNRVVRLNRQLIQLTDLKNDDLSTWKLTVGGVEVPLHVNDNNGNDRMDAGDWIQFYGQALDYDPKTVLDTELAQDSIYEYRDFTDENVYLLTAEAGARARMATQPGAPGPEPPPASFEAVAHEETDDAWRPLGSADPWYWAPTLNSDLVPERTEAVPLPGLESTGQMSARVKVHLRGLSEKETVDPDHRTRVTLLDSSSVALASDEATFDGRILQTHDFTWNYSGGDVLTDPVQVKVEALDVTGLSWHEVIVDWIEVHYQKVFNVTENRLTFDWPDGDAKFEVTGFSGPQPVEVYEITATVGGTGVREARRLLDVQPGSGSPYSVTFRIDNDPALADGTMRRFVVVGVQGVYVPTMGADMEEDIVSDLRDTSIQADLVVVTHPSVANTDEGLLSDLLALRNSQGITTKVALIDDVEDDFNEGLHGPLAIENFMRWVMSTEPDEGWSEPKPSWLLIIGDASYDFRAGTANGNFVSTKIFFLDRIQLGYYASDNQMTAVVGDDRVPDLVAGRIPARTMAEADLVMQKIIDYETAAPPGDWRKHAILISDRGVTELDKNEALEFEATNDAASSFMKAPPHTVKKLRYWSDFCDTVNSNCSTAATEQMRLAIKDAVNGTDPGDTFEGGAIVQFTGHGNFVVWSNDAYFDERRKCSVSQNACFEDSHCPTGETCDWNPDSADLVNGLKLPWMMAHNCLTGGFHVTLEKTVGEDWLFGSGGGSVSVLSPTGLSFNFIGRRVTETLFGSVYGPRKERVVGVPVLDVLVELCVNGPMEGCQNYALQGDPTLTLILPTVDAPDDLQAEGGNFQVTLDWDPSATSGATYDVYRNDMPDPSSYEKVNTAPVDGTTDCGETSAPCYVDDTVINTETYYYHVVAVDGEGFESRWSNFNSDCDLDPPGPDCVRVTPLNPDPPTPPQNVQVTDPENGGRLAVTWDANTERDLRSYSVHWGIASGVYGNSGFADKNETSFTITGLDNGTLYYVAVTATNTSGNTSAFSEEKTGIPTFVRGIKSPMWISDLHVDKSGNDALLSWTPVTEDIYGKPEVVDHYEVYRGESPDFVPGPATLIGEPVAASFLDASALLPGGPDYYYAVRAVDGDGHTGGLGGQLPDGISDLLAEWAGPGQCSVSGGGCESDEECPGLETCVPQKTSVRLFWSAVDREFSPSGDGAPKTIDSYEVWVHDEPFGRGDIDGGGPELLTTVTDTEVEVSPPTPDRYYSVLAVDRAGNRSPF